MIISVVSPCTARNGNSVSSILLGFALAELKRRVFLTHVKPRSLAFGHYLGLKDYEDKTSTPTQLVKLMREGAIQPEEIGDYCKGFDDFLEVFTNKLSNFSEHDMYTLLEFLTTSKSTPYEYLVFDIDESYDHPTAGMVIKNSNIIILNVADSSIELEEFNERKKEIIKFCRGKKVILLCSAFDSKAFKSTKEITSILGINTSCHMIRYNSWVKWACNNGRVDHFFKQGKIKDPDVIEVFKDVSSLASSVAKTKIVIGKEAKGVFKVW